jgi:hypothetical protein
MPLSTIFQLYLGSQYNWGRKPAYLEKIIPLSQVTDQLENLGFVYGLVQKCDEVE